MQPLASIIIKHLIFFRYRQQLLWHITKCTTHLLLPLKQTYSWISANRKSAIGGPHGAAYPSAQELRPPPSASSLAADQDRHLHCYRQDMQLHVSFVCV
jgi:hypothetical protein